MMDQIKKNREIISYIVFGALTTLVNYIVYFIFGHVLGIHYLVSNLTAWTVAVIFAYITNKYYVFEQNKTPMKVKEFGAGRIFTGLLEMLLLFVFVDVLHTYDLVAKVIIGVIVVVLNYIISKLLVFRE